jgi:hypothetical protein
VIKGAAEAPFRSRVLIRRVRRGGCLFRHLGLHRQSRFRHRVRDLHCLRHRNCRRRFPFHHRVRCHHGQSSGNQAKKQRSVPFYRTIFFFELTEKIRSNCERNNKLIGALFNLNGNGGTQSFKLRHWQDFGRYRISARVYNPIRGRAHEPRKDVAYAIRPIAGNGGSHH